MITDTLREIVNLYWTDAVVNDYASVTTGHINDTYRADVTINGISNKFIIQRINDYVFHSPEKVMHNIDIIGRHIASKPENERPACGVLGFVRNLKDETLTRLPDGGYWRISEFVKNSVSYDRVEDPCVLTAAGYAFGCFQQQLSDLPIDSIYETIPNFHNTISRLKDFERAYKENLTGRANEVKSEAEYIFAHADYYSQLCRRLDSGELHLCVTHNDTKYNNILIDRDTGKPVCVIDLDTVMPGLCAYDFGDAIRYAANTAAEDERDLSLVSIDLGLFERFTEGYLSATRLSLSPADIASLVPGALIMTAEVGMRFLGDYINGDKYFHISYPQHNLDRARCQLALAADMEKHIPEMNAIVEKYSHLF